MDTETKFKDVLITVFLEFKKFCEKHNLVYYMAYGTAIGVVRHHGIIPWDNDIDVWMPRKDYEIFKQLYSKQTSKEYGLITPETNPNYNLPFIKIYKKDSTILEQADFKMLSGVYVDIFPIDEGPNSISKQKYKALLCRYLSGFVYECGKIITFKSLSKAITEKSFMTLAVFISGPFRSTFRKLTLKLIKYLCTRKHKASQYYAVYLCGQTDLRTFFKKEWIQYPIYIDFEGIKVPLPNGYDKILTQIFGNYMTLPPVSERYNHNFIYVNLNEREEYNNVIKKIKNHK